ncbi:hypothetical protein [Pedobacter xixiisoli]|uniref:DUF1896 domain-containing protein n=1 Tax=Pedobacter xixiisoli TaxID=1476464 RepID=A0A286A721_9SPHI|nr:hypothetical protein [Pedobacter xixiisoli]SOD17689.1 hypothetical protein SAMN06297358_2638 [Pedobacter xixiisoli]
METALKEQLWQYIAQHNPDLMYDLQENYKVTEYLDQKVAEVLPEAEQLLDRGLALITVQEICFEQMTAELKPSKFLFIRSILEEEFPIAFEALQQSYMLNYELLNMMDCCRSHFEKFGIDQQDQIRNKALRYAIMGEIEYYLG